MSRISGAQKQKQGWSSPEKFNQLFLPPGHIHCLRDCAWSAWRHRANVFVEVAEADRECVLAGQVDPLYPEDQLSQLLESESVASVADRVHDWRSLGLLGRFLRPDLLPSWGRAHLVKHPLT